MDEIKEYKKQVRKDIRRTANRTSAVTLFTIFFVNAVAIIAGVILQKVNYWDVTPLSELTTSMLIQFIICFPIVVLIGSKVVKQPIRPLFAKPDATPGKIVKWSIIAIGTAQLIGMIFNIIFNIIQQQTGTELNAVTFLPNANTTDRVVLFVIIAFIGPVLEEIIFRGISLTPHIRFGQWFAVIVTGLLFGLYHVNYVQIFSAMVMGVAFGFLALKTRSIVVPVLVHIFNNTIGAIQYVALSYIDMDKLAEAEELLLSGSEKGMEMMEPMLGPVMVAGGMSFLVIIFGIVGVIMLIVELARNRGEYSLGKENCDGVPAIQKVFAYFTAPTTIVLMVVIVALTILNAFPDLLNKMLGI